MGGRILPGIGQLLLSLIAFALVMIWFFNTMKQYYSLMDEDIPVRISYARYGIAGFSIVGAAWLWALLTSISIVRNAKTPEPPPPGSVPPRITK